MAVAQPVAKFGKYELVKRIGQGGMAEVFLSRTRSIGGFERLVVIKRLLPQYASDANIVRLFLDEARIAARLHHANIVQVHDVDAADGAVFYAMEYLRGHDLREIVHALGQAEREFPLDQAIAIVLAVCAGLHHAHQLTGADGEVLHLVHRDVSPHNIVVLFDGSVKIIDFGIAKVRGTRADTQAGVVRGKYRYMSPEQALGQPLDGRSDVFATSIVLYELATGRRLFDLGEHDALRAIVYADAPAPSKAREDFPPELEKILTRGLARDRAARYPTALAMQHDLEAFARSQDLDVSAASLGRFMSALFRDEAADVTRPVLETLRDDTGLWALGPDAELASPETTTHKIGGSETATLTKTSARRRRAIAIAVASVALATCGIFAWRWQAGDSSSPETPPPVIASPPAAIATPLDAAAPVDPAPATPMAIETPPPPPHPQHKPRHEAKPPPPPPPPTLIVRPPLKDPDSLLPRYTTPRDAGT